MFGLDHLIADLGRGGNPAVVLAVALLLGLRHASDPDHLVALSALVAGERERRAWCAARLGLAWGLGHATSLLVLGIPFILVAAMLPRLVGDATEALIGLLIMLLAVRLLLRWQAGAFHAHAHRHGTIVHRHLHLHPHGDGHAHAHAPRVRSPMQAYGIGLVHGVGGSAGVALLLLAGIRSRSEALATLLLFAAAAADSMGLLSTGLGLALGLPRVEAQLRRAVPALAAGSFFFGLVYAAAALGGA